MLRIAVVTFYYYPDLCAGSFRMNAFVKALRNLMPIDGRIEVLTTMPNRYQSFKAEAAEIEEDKQLTIRRFTVPAHKSGLLDQSQSFLHFSRAVRCYTQGKHYDLVFATSSRLMTAALGASIARKSNAPLYLDMRDIFTDTMTNVLNPIAKLGALPFLRLLEKRTMRSADKINLVSRGFSGYFDQYRNYASLSYFTNGIDPEFVGRDFEDSERKQGRRVILYAGNLGEGQGLHKIIPAAARELYDTFEFLVVGDGGRKPLLVERCSGLDNVHLMDPVGRYDLLDLYASADILFLHLNDYEAFKKVLPSKIFEYAATGKPVLAGVAGYAAEFLEEKVENAAVFSPCDSVGLVAAIETLKFESTDRHDFIQEYARDNIMDKMAADVLSLLPEPTIAASALEESRL